MFCDSSQIAIHVNEPENMCHFLSYFIFVFNALLNFQHILFAAFFQFIMTL